MRAIHWNGARNSSSLDPWNLSVLISDISSEYIYIIWYNLLTFYSGILFLLTFSLAFYLAFFLPKFWHTFWYAIWHSIWHSILAFYLASILTFFSGILFRISSDIFCGGGPAGNTLIRSSRFRSGGEHFDPELAVKARRGSWACGGGPAGNTLIRSLRWRSGGEHCDLELPAGNAAI